MDEDDTKKPDKPESAFDSLKSRPPAVGKNAFTKKTREFRDEFAAMASAGDTPLMEAVQEGDLAKVKEMIEGGADIHAPNAIGNTALHYAGSTGQAEIAQYLVGKGAKVNARNSTGATPFFLAVINSRVQTGAKLLLLGADKSIRGHQDQTAYERARAVGLQKNVDQIETAISRYHANRSKMARSRRHSKKKDR